MNGYQGLNESNLMYENPEGSKNRYIYVKQGNSSIPNKSSTILVNPHFRDNTKVFINPNFAIKPNIHVNPMKIKPNIQLPEPQSSISTDKVSYCNRSPLKSIPTDERGRILVSTKNKLIKVPQNKNSNSKEQNDTFPSSERKNYVIGCAGKSSSRFKKVNKISPINDVGSIKRKNIVNVRSKIVNSPYSIKRISISTPRTSLTSKFKYVRSPSIITKKVFRSDVIRTKHKIVNNSSNSNTNVQFIPNISTVNRRKYVFINKFNSSSFVANNVILKNSKWKNLSVNGILYKNSPSFLKQTQVSPNKTLINNKRNNVKLSPLKLRRKSSIGFLKSRGQYKLIRLSVPSLTKLKKSNISCPIYKKFGRCKGQKDGSCIKIHNPDQIFLCTKFLQGACVKRNCLLSHKVSPEKMPTCKYYLEGLCGRDECPYLHVKISPKADICREFLEGFCKAGVECDKRHQFLCPEFEKSKKCSKRKCDYPHITHTKTTVKPRKSLKNTNKRKNNKITAIDEEEKPKARYYEENDNQKKDGETLISSRPKLGSLPSFIPFNEENS